MTNFKEMAKWLNETAQQLEDFGLLDGDRAMLRDVAKQLEEFAIVVCVGEGDELNVSVNATIPMTVRIAYWNWYNEMGRIDVEHVYGNDPRELDAIAHDQSTNENTLEIYDVTFDESEEDDDE